MAQRKKRNPHFGSNFDDFLKEEGLFEEVQAKALKRALSEQSRAIPTFSGIRRCQCAVDRGAASADTWGRAVEMPVFRTILVPGKELHCHALIAMITSTISIEVTTMIREAAAMTVRQNLGELLNEVQYRHGKVLITKAGKPVAALVDIAMFTRLRKLDEEFDRMRAELAQAFEGMTEKAVDALVVEAVKGVRARRRKK